MDEQRRRVVPARMSRRNLADGTLVEFIGFAGAPIPAALLAVHKRGCIVCVSWNPAVNFKRLDGTASVTNTLDSLRPLTLGEPITCPRCGETGSIVDDRWLPVAAPQEGDA